MSRAVTLGSCTTFVGKQLSNLPSVTCVLQVLALEPVIEGRNQMATVRLHRSDQTVSVRCKDLGERWEAAGGSGEVITGHSAEIKSSERDRDLAVDRKEKKREKEPKRDRADRGPSDKSKVRSITIEQKTCSCPAEYVLTKS